MSFSLMIRRGCKMTFLEFSEMPCECLIMHFQAFQPSLSLDQPSSTFPIPSQSLPRLLKIQLSPGRNLTKIQAAPQVPVIIQITFFKPCQALKNRSFSGAKPNQNTSCSCKFLESLNIKINLIS